MYRNPRFFGIFRLRDFFKRARQSLSFPLLIRARRPQNNKFSNPQNQNFHEESQSGHSNFNTEGYMKQENQGTPPSESNKIFKPSFKEHDSSITHYHTISGDEYGPPKPSDVTHIEIDDGHSFIEEDEPGYETGNDVNENPISFFYDNIKHSDSNDQTGNVYEMELSNIGDIQVNKENTDSDYFTSSTPTYEVYFETVSPMDTNSGTPKAVYSDESKPSQYKDTEYREIPITNYNQPLDSIDQGYSKPDEPTYSSYSEISIPIEQGYNDLVKDIELDYHTPINSVTQSYGEPSYSDQSDEEYDEASLPVAHGYSVSPYVGLFPGTEVDYTKPAHNPTETYHEVNDVRIEDTTNYDSNDIRYPPVPNFNEKNPVQIETNVIATDANIKYPNQVEQGVLQYSKYNSQEEPFDNYKPDKEQNYNHHNDDYSSHQYGVDIDTNKYPPIFRHPSAFMNLNTNIRKPTERPEHSPVDFLDEHPNALTYAPSFVKSNADQLDYNENIEKRYTKSESIEPQYYDSTTEGDYISPINEVTTTVSPLRKPAVFKLPEYEEAVANIKLGNIAPIADPYLFAAGEWSKKLR